MGPVALVLGPAVARPLLLAVYRAGGFGVVARLVRAAASQDKCAYQLSGGGEKRGVEGCPARSTACVGGVNVLGFKCPVVFLVRVCAPLQQLGPLRRAVLAPW